MMAAACSSERAGCFACTALHCLPGLSVLQYSAYKEEERNECCGFVDYRICSFQSVFFERQRYVCSFTAFGIGAFDLGRT